MHGPIGKITTWDELDSSAARLIYGEYVDAGVELLRRESEARARLGRARRNGTPAFEAQQDDGKRDRRHAPRRDDLSLRSPVMMSW